jgi:hypothetical protein
VAKSIRTLLALSLVITGLTTGLEPTSFASAVTPRGVVTVTGGDHVADAGGYRYHAFLHDPLDTFQGHPGSNGCASGCSGTNHGGGGGGGFGAPGGQGTPSAGGDGGPGFRTDLLPAALIDALAGEGVAIGETSTELGGVWFAGGGGGGTFFQTSSTWLNAGNSSTGTVGKGGRGGGGDGAPGDPEGISQGDHALPNTGGGGGGSGSSRTAEAAGATKPEGKGRGGDGGSGVLIVRWLLVDAPTLSPDGALVRDHGSHRYAIYLHTGDPGGSSTFTLSLTSDLSIEYLAVGGGGGGGGETYDDYGSGGGGAGGVVSTLGRPLVLTAGDHVVEVGGGGRGGDGVAATNQIGEVGQAGRPSRLGDVAHARGGGGGAARQLPAGSGASGGGGTSQAAGTPGSGTPGATSATLEVAGGTVDADVLVIAGGGSGGAGAGGGGGAGGVEWNLPPSGSPVEAGVARFAPLPLSGSYTITVGAGGNPVGAAASPISTYSVGKDGSPSTFAALPGASAASIEAVGGGGGGRRPDIAIADADDGLAPHGRDGGSGGGAGRALAGQALGTAGTNVATLGHAGGTGVVGSQAGGGGGAGTAGGSSTGGDGTPLFDAFLAPFGLGEVHDGVRHVAAGGGGLSGTGGIGGGGDGTSAAARTSAASGLPGTGSGGGALGAFTSTSGAGGSGVVIVRYPIPAWQQEGALGAIRIGDPLELSALIGAVVDDVAAPIELLDGTLPPGITLTGTAMSGTASTAGTYTFTLRAFDRPGSEAGVAVDREFTVEVFDALIVEEPFSTVPGPEWVLTGGGGSTPEVVDGALRVTPALASRSGFALYDVPQQARAGLDVTFRASVWQPANASGADGLVFFLKRGDDTSVTPGAFGSRLGYGTGGSTPGISGALLGVGLDTFGGYRRFSINGNPVPFTCPTIDQVGQTPPGDTVSANNLSVRGPGQGTDGYCLLAPSVTISPGWGRTGSAPDGTRTREAGARQIRVRYDYVPGVGGTPPSGQVRIWVDEIGDGDTPKITLPAPQELLDAETFKFGFSGATGGQFNNQEIWDVVVRSVNPLAPIEWTDTALDEAVTGQAYTASFDQRARGGVRPFSFALVGGQLPPGLTLNSPLTGTPTQPGTYSFDVTATSQRGDVATETFTLVVKDEQTIEFSISNQPLDAGTLTIAPVSRAATSSTATGLPITVVSDTTSVCTVSGLTVTLVAVGTCTLTASQAGGSSGGLTYAAADAMASFEIVDVDVALSGLSVSNGSISPVFDPATTTYSVTVPNSVASIRVTPTVANANATVTVNGTILTSGTPSDMLPLTVGANTIVVTVANGGFERSTTLTVTRAAPAPGPALPVVVAPPLPAGPVLTAGTPPRPSRTPTARIGDREVPVAATPAGTTRQIGTTTVSTATILEVGGVSLALDMTGAGEVRTNSGAAPEVRVVRDAVARTSGGGLLPGTQVQAWLPLAGGTTIRPVTTIPVAADGTFAGELPFDGRTDRQSDGRPLPIGTHVLQLVGVDAAGEITVIEQTVRIEQPDPSPEPDRRAGAPPTLRPGASIATNAGVPEAVTIVPVPEVRQARVEGTGWTMAVDVPSADGRVAPAEGGGALIELVEEDFAEVSGDGFLPGTRADVWLFSTPTLLGTVTIGPDGSFTGLVPVTGIATGEHTLQLQGVGRDGYVRAANLGVAVVPRASEETAPQPEPEPEPEATPEPAPERPADSVEVITATGPEPSGGSPLVWIALLAAVLGSSGWWFLVGRRRRDDEEAEAAHQG